MIGAPLSFTPPIGGFWVEWPGSKSTAWVTPGGHQTWKFRGTNARPHELPFPLQGEAANSVLNARCAAPERFRAAR